MKERLLGFVFLGVLVAWTVNFITDEIHIQWFAESLWFQAHWYIPFLIAPVAALLVLAFACGLFRPKGPRWADAVALLAIALIVYCTLGASYSCWHYCF